MGQLNLVLGTLIMTVLAISGTARADDVPEPRLGLFLDAADIARARQRVESDRLAAEWRDHVMKIADEWVERPDDWIRDILPAPGARFSYGIAGCPECGKSWGRFGEPVASFDRPRVLICPHCETVFDLNNPDPKYADSGDGVVVNGQRFYLEGVWNGFVVQAMWSAFSHENAAIVNLADAYALTGDERYARKAIVIMDALATLMPHTNGPRDFTTELDKDMGRLQHLTSIVFRAQMHFARALDMVGRLPELQEESATNPGQSVWDNIRQGVFEEYLFEPIDTRNGKLRTLHNHEADSIRGLVLVGMLYGEPDYLRWGATGVQAFLDNTIDRDGLYYETSLSYTDFTRSVFHDMAELVVRYDPDNYPGVDMPRREELPFDGNYFNHPGLARLTLEMPYRVSILGRQPTYGNSKFDLSVWKKPGRAFVRWEHNQILRMMMYATDPALRERASELARAMEPFAGQRPLGGWWTVYRAPDIEPIADAAEGVPEHLEPDFMGQTGLALLRSGEGATRRGAVVRVGPNLPHAHDDAGALMLYAHGRALSGDLGYGSFGNHVHLGWAGRAIAHNMVVVNQDQSQGQRLFRMGPGGTIERFVAAPGVSLVETTVTANYAPSDELKDYRRLVMQVDLSPDAAYWIDLFDVDGGFVHDYSFHARPLGDEGSFEITGTSPQPVEDTWTLAALDPQYKSGSFDQPGRSWGERLRSNGMIAKIPGVEDEVPEEGWWYATPGNGYGFLHDLRLAETADPYHATWRWNENGDTYGLRLTMLPEAPQQVIHVKGPSITGSTQMEFLVARNGQPGNDQLIRTRYAAVMESFGEQPQIDHVEAIRDAEEIVGLRITSGEIEDTLLDARRRPSADLASGLALVRRRGEEIQSVLLNGAPRLSVDGIQISPKVATHETRIAEVNDEAGTFRLDTPLPASAEGSTVLITNPAYSHGSAYRVEVLADGWLRPINAEITLGRAHVESVEDGTVTATAPLVFGYEYDTSTRFLAGKRIVVGGRTGNITDMKDFKVVGIDGVSPSPGEGFTVYDIQPGDAVRMDAVVSLTRVDGGWELRSNVPVTVTLPDGEAYEVDASALAKGHVLLKETR